MDHSSRKIIKKMIMLTSITKENKSNWSRNLKRDNLSISVEIILIHMTSQIS